MAVYYNDLAGQLKELYPRRYGEMADEDVVKRHMVLEPEIKDYIIDLDQLFPTKDPIEEQQLQQRIETRDELRDTGMMPPAPTHPFAPALEDFYDQEAITKPEDTASHFDFIKYQAKEMTSGIPEWFVGSMAVVTGSENLGALAEEMRAESAQQTQDWLAESPDIVAYLEWIKDEPVTMENFWHRDMLERGLAQAVPSMATLIGTELALWGFTGGIGGVINKARQGGKLIKGFLKATAATKFGRKATTMSSMGVYEAAGEYSEAMDYLVTEKGMDPMQAQKIAAGSALFVGAINGAIEYLPLGHLKKYVFSDAAKREGNNRIIRKVTDILLDDNEFVKGLANISAITVKQGLLEGGQEWSQHVVQSIAQLAYKNGYGEDLESAFEALANEAFSPQAMESAYSGFATGTVMGVVGASAVEMSARQKRALERQGEGKYGITEETPLEVLPGTRPEDQVIEEDLSRGQLVMRAFTTQKTAQAGPQTQTALENIEEELGSVLDIKTNTEVRENWKSEIKNVITDNPEALADIPDWDEALESIEVHLGKEFRDEVEDIYEPPREEEPPVAPEPSIDIIPPEEDVAPPIEEGEPLDITPPEEVTPPEEEVVETQMEIEDLFKKKEAPVEVGPVIEFPPVKPNQTQVAVIDGKKVTLNPSQVDRFQTAIVLGQDSEQGQEILNEIKAELIQREAPAEAPAELQKIKLLQEKLSKARKAHTEMVEKEGFLPGEGRLKTQKKIDEITRELRVAKDAYGKITEAPLK